MTILLEARTEVTLSGAASLGGCAGDQLHLSPLLFFLINITLSINTQPHNTSR